ESEARVLRYFPTLSVFDIAHTEPLEGAKPLPEDPTHRLVGNDDLGIITPSTAHLQSHAWSLHREPLSSVSGYTDPESHRVTLAENLAAEQAAKTLIHETAHIELRHIDSVEEYRGPPRPYGGRSRVGRIHRCRPHRLRHQRVQHRLHRRVG
ncbi:MAG: hypothetical protein ACTHJI_01215, partial [Leifsonia sp.]